MVLANIFQPLIDIFGPVLVFLHSMIGGSWGWSIIALTVVVRALLLPLAFKQMHSIQKLQQVAPQMKTIQAKYKDDKQRQQQEIMRFYKENDIHPFASLLPLVAQIPVFIGLYYTLGTRLREDICPGLQAAFRHAYAAHHNLPLHEAAGHTVACHRLNGSSWPFIHDLTSTATGLTLVVLIVLYVGTQLASCLMMQAPTVNQTQRRVLLLLLPLFFVIFIINFPAGLILYWITTNTWTLGQQWVIRRRIRPVVPVAPNAPASSPGGRDGRRAAVANGDVSGGGADSPGYHAERPGPRRSSPPGSGRARARAARRRRVHATRGSIVHDAGASHRGRHDEHVRVRARATRADRASVGVDARVQLEEDAEGVSAKYVHEDLELVIGHQGDHVHSLLLDAGDHRPAAGLPRVGRGTSTAARRGITRVRADPDSPLPFTRGPSVRDHCTSHELRGARSAPRLRGRTSPSGPPSPESGIRWIAAHGRQRRSRSLARWR
jgi:YidC/Oxa1 family membrane protein insertase